MKAKLQQFWQAFRPVLIGWVSVALLLPTLLAVTPSAAAAHAISFSEICSAQNANLPGDHKKHSQDCPCCLLGCGQSAVLAPRDFDLETVPQPRTEAAFLQHHAAEFSAQIYNNFAFARGPPAFLNI